MSENCFPFHPQCLLLSTQGVGGQETLVCFWRKKLKKFDKKFEKDPNFVFYDFNKPEDIPEKFDSFFDFVLIDPPFIT